MTYRIEPRSGGFWRLFIDNVPVLETRKRALLLDEIRTKYRGATLEEK